MSTLLLALGLAGGAQEPVAREPASQAPIEVRLDRRSNLTRGDEVRVFTRTLRDGYLLVLHAEPDGRIRVLFPLDPLDDHYVRGARDYEIRGRGDREAFRVHLASGVGTVYAAYSRDPFQVGELIRGDHWDYALDAWRVRDDPEAELTLLADRMATDAGFEYDLVRYDVLETVAYQGGYHYGGGAYASSYGYYPHSFFSPRFGVVLASCASFFFDPFFCFSFVHHPFFVGFRHGFAVALPRHDRFRNRAVRIGDRPYRFKDPPGTARSDVIRVRQRPAPDDAVTGRRRVVPPTRAATVDQARRIVRPAPSLWRGRTAPRTIQRPRPPTREFTPVRGRTPVHIGAPGRAPARASPVRAIGTRRR